MLYVCTNYYLLKNGTVVEELALVCKFSTSFITLVFLGYRGSDESIGSNIYLSSCMFVVVCYNP